MKIILSELTSLTCVGCLRGLEAGFSLTPGLVSLCLLLAGLERLTESEDY